ncbi:response regulator transcription factor [Geminicoccus roseus]|uniref:response regulator transcription factor n=1 Tax=Geminicoccus roseus TaxID=404900 RepID=UPI000686A98B|nr:response regulator transcription factor [Geminicoccus roseus]
MLQQLSWQALPSPDPIGMEQPIVLVVDDDLAVREGLSELILSIGLSPICFASTQELLASGKLDRLGCLILDVRMPGTSGLDLQRHLAQGRQRKPIIFLTGHGDIPMSVQAMKAGAVDFLTKPVRDQVLLDAIARAIERDLADRAAAQRARQCAERFETLTLRERQVFREVAKGQLNKQIAFNLGISEVTVKIHRSNLMRKMQVRSIVDLIRIWELLNINGHDG